MNQFNIRFARTVRIFFLGSFLLAVALDAVAAESFRVPILLYHRFGPTVADGMTITTPVFESHMKYLKDNGYKVIPLRRLIDIIWGKRPLRNHGQW